MYNPNMANADPDSLKKTSEMFEKMSPEEKERYLN